jgi:membrane protein DedA with SNARE-associated domain
MIESLIIHKLSYAGMFVLLAGAGIIAPVPEELTLLTAGYLSAIGVMLLTRAIPLAILALLTGDTFLFSLAKFGAPYAKKIHARLVESGLHNSWIFDPERPLRAVFLLRFVTGIRLITPIFAGINDASWVGFIATDLAALVIFVPVMTWLGWHFHATFLEFVAVFELARHIVFGTIVAVVGGSVLIAVSPRLHRWYQRFKNKHHE